MSLYHQIKQKVGVSSLWSPRPGGGGSRVTRPLTKPFYASSRKRTPVSLVMTLPFQAGKLRLRKATGRIERMHQEGWENLLPRPFHGHPISCQVRTSYCLVCISWGVLGIYKCSHIDLFLTWCVRAQSCLNLCDPMDCSPSGSAVHGIFQAGILEWVAISSSRESSRPRI